MISRIKNRHLRRLAIIGWSFFYFVARPFMAIVEFVPQYISEWWSAFYKVWNQP
jgi:hypothetical protein